MTIIVSDGGLLELASLRARGQTGEHCAELLRIAADRKLPPAFTFPMVDCRHPTPRCLMLGAVFFVRPPHP